MTKQSKGTKATKQRCEDCNRPTTRHIRTANASYIYRCNRCSSADTKSWL